MILCWSQDTRMSAYPLHIPSSYNSGKVGLFVINIVHTGESLFSATFFSSRSGSSKYYLPRCHTFPDLRVSVLPNVVGAPQYQLADMHSPTAWCRYSTLVDLGRISGVKRQGGSRTRRLALLISKLRTSCVRYTLYAVQRLMKQLVPFT
jgi:hypothetical protein